MGAEALSPYISRLLLAMQLNLGNKDICLSLKSESLTEIENGTCIAEQEPI